MSSYTKSIFNAQFQIQSITYLSNHNWLPYAINCQLMPNITALSLCTGWPSCYWKGLRNEAISHKRHTKLMISKIDMLDRSWSSERRFRWQLLPESSVFRAEDVVWSENSWSSKSEVRKLICRTFPLKSSVHRSTSQKSIT